MNADFRSFPPIQLFTNNNKITYLRNSTSQIPIFGIFTCYCPFVRPLVTTVNKPLAVSRLCSGLKQKVYCTFSRIINARCKQLINTNMFIHKPFRNQCNALKNQKLILIIQSFPINSCSMNCATYYLCLAFIEYIVRQYADRLEHRQNYEQNTTSFLWPFKGQ